MEVILQHIHPGLERDLYIGPWTAYDVAGKANIDSSDKPLPYHNVSNYVLITASIWSLWIYSIEYSSGENDICVNFVSIFHQKHITASMEGFPVWFHSNPVMSIPIT